MTRKIEEAVELAPLIVLELVLVLDSYDVAAGLHDRGLPECEEASACKD
jgi:hypothetical protein